MDEHDPIWHLPGFGWKCICGADLPTKADRGHHLARAELEAHTRRTDR